MIAIVAETKDGSARKITLEMLAEARRLADAKGGLSVGAIILGALASGEADRLASHGADRVLHVEGSPLASYVPEAWAEGVRLAVEKAKPDVLLLGATAHGKDLAPRVSARLRVGLASDCVAFEWGEEGLVARRPIFAGKAFARVAWSASRPQVASVRPNTFTPAAPDPSRKATVESIARGEV
jgi:electron transfer flavoprotein alpha subunit